mgnify:CR=1 FL=1
MELEEKKEVQDRLLGVCADLLQEARYPLVVSYKVIDRVIRKLQKIRKQVE